MAYTIENGLCSLDDVKGVLGISDTIDDYRISLAIESASRMIEAYCNRYFRQDTGVSTRKFIADDAWLCEVDDISTTTGLIVKTDYAGDGTFGTIWSATDYQLEPLNGIMQGLTGWPYTKIRAIAGLNFPVYGGAAIPRPYAQALVAITAQWGWAAIPTPVKKACIHQAALIFKSDDVPLGATPFQESGILRLRAALHPMALSLLAPYAENTVFVA